MIEHPPWLDKAGRFFNPQPRVSVLPLPLPGGARCIVIDEVLAHPQGLRQWAATQVLQPPAYPYPGLVGPVPDGIGARLAELFAQHARRALGGRRTLDCTARVSMVTTAPEALLPIQWLCHRDRFEQDQPSLLFAASVLYLFEDPALGGTSFYRPLCPMPEIERLVADSQLLGAHDFSARYGVQPGYMAGSNRYFEKVAEVPAAWNRVIFYDGGIFHSGEVGEPGRLVADPLRGRLTLNSFITCHKGSG